MANTVQFNFTDRYQALGMPYPDPETMCTGPCEGIGFYPCKNDEEMEAGEYAAWLNAHERPEAHNDQTEKCDGWHFIRCPDCDGSGKRNEKK